MEDSPALRLLVVEDDAAHLALITRAFDDSMQIQGVGTIAAARKALTEQTPDIVLSDLRLPDGHGTDLLDETNVPVVLMTAQGDEAVAVEAMRAGALDYVVKTTETIRNMPQVVRRAMHSWEQVVARRRAEAALRESEERLRATLGSLNDVVLVVDPAGRIVDLHAPQELRDDYSADGFRGKPLRALPAADMLGPLEDAVAKALEEDARQTVELTSYETGDPRHFRARVNPLHADEQTAGVTILLREVTAEREAYDAQSRLEARLGRAQRLETVGTLASGIAHDFNNILMPILIGAEIVRDSLPAQSEAHQELESIKASVLRARDLIARMLTFSREATPTRRPVELANVVRDALQLVRASLPSTTTIINRIPANVAIVKADTTQVHQVVMNLCVNAHHALDSKPGRIVVALRTEAVDAAAAAEHPDLEPRDYAVLEVRDDGTGIAPEVLHRIFEPFFTTRAPGVGTGLGLSVVHGIVLRHNGAVLVESKPDEDTRFSVYLPVATARLTPSRQTKAKEIRRGSGRVFYVDDEPAVAKLGRSALRLAGYTVSAFGSAAEALAAFEADPDEVDLVITDLTMPNMTGLELARALKSIRPGLPVILTTGALVGAVAEGPIDLVLRKPCGVDELTEAAARYLAGRRPR